MPLSKQRRKLIQDFFKDKQIEADLWCCCDVSFNSIVEIGKHVNNHHQADLDQREQTQLEQLEKHLQEKTKLAKLKQRRGEKGTSDPITADCSCDLQDYQVILFYRYTKVDDPVQFALDHQQYCAKMTGKVRIAQEGINTTLAGTNEDIETYLDWLTRSTQPFEELKELQYDSQARHKFFKPSKGCIHVFKELSIKLVDEICPLGQSSVIVDTLKTQDHQHGKLGPIEFHQQLLSDNDYILLDTRNYYESHIGHFKNAIKPPIRKFSQLPEYVERNKHIFQGKKKILTYCTGGIRCEKATAYMRQALPEQDIFMLDGGIHNYLEWHQQSNQQQHVWLGKNYVFDARQSLGSGTIVSQCQDCQEPWDQYKKCTSPGCHLLVLICDSCQSKYPQVYCCQECQQTQAGFCQCEKKRRERV
ncbi:thiosulfate sulfurtransferase (rhodanese)-like domain-containing protein 2 [Rhizopus stolonifer]|uniref:Thiosulfate sulfurtransferase (Rhodanese)-like domain-containing protein 2 n=1 Tax=Rhizopus stolonifer TaxID=4846 RepID=A0A367KNQ3_RHIST|nr:thiosulfate sulfurtransferase (rhodanese)-like domain-containing protein 2 [Rhizopus stolonifer]